jgi:hypothetical protein
VDAPFVVTFTDNATYRAAITSVTVGGTTLTAGYTVSPGQITFTPSASAPVALLQSSGTKSIVVIATGYTNNTVSQTIGVGADRKLAITTQPTAPASNGASFAVQPVVRIQDQYGNTTTSTATVTAAVGAGTWTLGGTVTKAGVAGTATFTGLTATSELAVTGATITFSSGSLTSVTSSSFNIPVPVVDYITLATAGTAATETFDGMAATLNLPTGWKMGASTSSPTWSGAGTVVTQQASSGSPTAGGTYNWGSSASERAVGALTSGGFSSPNNLLVKIRNNTGSVLNALSVDYKAERYRINTAAASVSFFYSLDGTTWSSISDGDIATSSFPTGPSAYTFTGGTTVTRSAITQTGLSVANGSYLYLRWNIDTVGSNSQGIGIDDISVTSLLGPTATTGSASALAQTTATLGGNITATGGANATQRGVYVSTTNGFADGAGIKVSATGSFGTGVYTVNATGLNAGTVYYFKAFAVNTVGTSYGAQGTFTTLVNVPVVTVASVPGTVGNSLIYDIIASGNPTSYAVSSGALPDGLSLNTSTGAITGTPTTAATGTVVAVTATNSGGTSSAANLTFNIAKGTPSITVPPDASSITYRQTLASSNLTGGAASVSGAFAFTTPSTAPNAGTASQGVTFTPTDTTNYNTAATSASVTVVPATLESDAVHFTPSGGGYTASSGTASSFSITYAGRNGTTYASSATVPTRAGFYTVTATSTDPNYSGSNTLDYFIAGPFASADAFTRPANSAGIRIPVASLLANDSRVTSGGSIATDNLSVTAVTAGTGNSVSLSGGFVLYTPSVLTNNDPLTFTYTLSDGSTTDTATVTVSSGAATTFTLSMLRVVTPATFASGNTTVTVEFAGVPNQTYNLEYTTNLDSGPWLIGGAVGTGSTGTFNVTFTASGDQTAAWSSLFFRATR